MNPISIRRAAKLLGIALLGPLASCGGGGEGAPSVATLSATNLLFSQLMTVTVNGSALEGTAIEMFVDGPCSNVARVGTGSALQQQFTCRVTGIGAIRPLIRSGTGGQELASLRVNVLAPQVTMTVEQGDREGTVVLELDPVAAPVTAANFLGYVNSNFYRNTIFHRVEPGFLVQGGGYTTAVRVKAPTGPAIVLETDNGLKNLRGTIAMVRGAQANSATSQFYLNLADNPSLDAGSATLPGGNAVFGRVISGLAVVDEIGIVPTRNDTTNNLPTLPVTNVVISAAAQTR